MNCTHFQNVVSYDFILFLYPTYDNQDITPCEVFISTAFASLFNPIVSLEIVLIPMIDYIATT